jgi:hypothetical protein
MLEHETLTDMDDETRLGLAEAADHVLHGPERLKAKIIAAGRNGEKPADIHKVIHPAYTYDYVAKLIREDRAARTRQSPDAPQPPGVTPDGT